MCTVIKVKRKITEDPVDCLILECKKRRKQLAPNLENQISNDASSSPTNRIDSIKQILKYAGSAKNENEISDRLIQLSANLKSTIDNFIKNPKTPNKKTPNSKQAKLNLSKAETKSHRYVLLNKKRGIDSLDSDTIEKITSQEGSIDKTELAINEYGDMNILDVVVSDECSEESEEGKTENEEKIMCNGVELVKKKTVDKTSSEYVYDIYYAKNEDIHLDLLYPSNFTINSMDLEFAENEGSDEAEEFYEDDEDSNDEGNWRNDYPDEEADDDADDIDEEDDDDGYLKQYGLDCMGGYGEDGDDNKLSEAMWKNCNLDGSYYEDEECSDDYDEYNNEDSKLYSAYKKKLIRDLDK